MIQLARGFVSIYDTVRFPRRQAANFGPALFRPGTNEVDVLMKLLLFCEVKETPDTKIYFSPGCLFGFAPQCNLDQAANGH
jgi:hypothetical protein